MRLLRVPACASTRVLAKVPIPLGPGSMSPSISSKRTAFRGELVNTPARCSHGSPSSCSLTSRSSFSRRGKWKGRSDSVMDEWSSVPSRVRDWRVLEKWATKVPSVESEIALGKVLEILSVARGASQSAVARSSSKRSAQPLDELAVSSQRLLHRTGVLVFEDTSVEIG